MIIMNIIMIIMEVFLMNVILINMINDGIINSVYLEQKNIHCNDIKYSLLLNMFIINCYISCLLLPYIKILILY